MSSPPIVIDTCSFRDRDFIRGLPSYHGRKVISSITYAEMQVFLIFQKKKEESYFDGILIDAGVEIQNYSKNHGLITANFGGNMGEFSNMFRDYAIASHAFLPPWIVVTNNKKDFEFLSDRVLSPSEFRNQYMP